jgi:nucleotide-binding universal stress UspA family protein
MKILVGLDGSAFSEAVLPAVAGLASHSDVQVELVTVIDEDGVRAWITPPASPVDQMQRVDEYSGLTLSRERKAPVPVETSTQTSERVQREAREYLERVAKKQLPRGAQVKVITNGNPAEELVKLARKDKADLIAMATHGRTGLARLALGSVATKVLASGAAPVLLVRPKGLKS